MEQQGALEATLEVRLTKSEVEAEVNKQLKDYQRKAAMPGFRAGKVPFGMVKKMYGTALTAEQINKKVSDGLNQYLEENKIQFLGYPVADHERTGRIDFDAQDEFSFYFTMGMKPVLDLNLSQISIEYPKVNVDEAMVNNTIERIMKDLPKITNPEEVGQNDRLRLKVNLADENGREVEGGFQTTITIDLSDEKFSGLKAVFEGRPEGDEFVLKFADHLPSEEVARILRLTEEQQELTEKPFNVVIDQIFREEPAVLDEEFFKRVFPDREIQTEEEFRAAVAEEVQKQYNSQSDYLAYLTFLKQNLTEEFIPLPDNFLRRWLAENVMDANAKEDIDKEFESYKRTFRYQVLVDHLRNDYPELEVRDEEIRQYAFNQYYGQYLGLIAQDEALMNQLMGNIDQMIAKNKDRERLHNLIEENKLIKLIRENAKLVEKPVTLDEFNQMAKSFETTAQ